MSTFVWIVVPYVCIGMFIGGHIWRWRHDQFGWTTHTSQILENRLLRLGSPLFHLGAFGVIAGHAMGLLVPASLTSFLGVSEHLYHLVSVTGGVITGVMLVAGLSLLIARRFVSGRIRRVTTTMDKVLYAALAAMVVLGMSGTVVINLFGEGYDYRETLAVWFRQIFYLQPDPSLMADAPLVFQLHAIGGFLFLAMWPFTRLVHVWSAPLAYLWRPYVVYRGRRGPAPTPQPAPSAVRTVSAARPSGQPSLRPSVQPSDQPGRPTVKA
ncbi:nitrate reductase subunit gamma [Actinoplanes lobatus]|uniref:Nitrate reductase-like protein NarX n=1 Tax=Actinoplanes lobatus TaxID=113568 RepID=A0A7W7HP20_9ACTN|nr:respiratory nitrate reductase subunit gamma [Actinoplanes lobatus]MBB4754063.1 nitrate reductase gamma subunit [Actinoplanes lobatus]GGN76666.1 nitrate reductase subunit gamma [Actinoplanes lobatus]GIE40881.1 nitrate reductase subunit gamma [Actinoplanes lobatus]